MKFAKRVNRIVQNDAELADYLRPGSEQLCAGYAIYGPSTMMVLTSGHGVNGFIRIQTMGASIPEVFAEIKWLIILTVVYGGLACIGIHQVIGREQREHPARKENGDEGR